LEDLPVAHIMTTKELSRYLKLHEITIRKYAAAGQIAAVRVGRVWRFDNDVIDDRIRTGQNETKVDGRSKRKGGKEESGKQRPRK
jgi:excisionase family DNA binding protein